ncbi:RmlC-like cupin domain-containing protein [Scheffersomyces coipomensis]|uniref:RmlC-like cupin domain-containing protein n=1 Tax=Scheffersomyces coipomensis TaxID=1788519 RepID=UPI00315CA3E3
MLTVNSTPNPFERAGTPTSSSTSCGMDRLPSNNHLAIDTASKTIDSLSKDSPFYTLIEELKVILGGKGLHSDEIDVDKIKQLMENYESNEEDWLKYALYDPSRGYSRNGIININDNANLLILVWSPGKSSAIHDHANAHCCMKILAGELMESLYDIPDQNEQKKLVCKKETLMTRDQVGYISDKIGLHKISNPIQDKVSVSLHLYTPPYAYIYGCSMYEQNNGKRHHVDMNKYYSWQGKLINPKESHSC